ncbi:MAG: type III pantothenate kinase [Bacteroidota bacterium]
MNLVIDSGNTFTKIAVVENNEIIHLKNLAQADWEQIAVLLEEFHVQAAIVSDVTGSAIPLARRLQERMPAVVMDTDTPVPLKKNYHSPATLGSDRLAAAVCGAFMFPGKNVLVIQAGTCITWEVVSAHAAYEGGGISPGLGMRFQALHTFTARLPLVKKQEISFLTGKNTEESVLSGVINGCTAEIDGIIDQYKEIFPDLVVVLGGGDTFFFDKKLKNRIFALQNLVVRGLHIILEYNLNGKK